MPSIQRGGKEHFYPLVWRVMVTDDDQRFPEARVFDFHGVGCTTS